MGAERLRQPGSDALQKPGGGSEVRRGREAFGVREPCPAFAAGGAVRCCWDLPGIEHAHEKRRRGGRTPKPGGGSEGAPKPEQQTQWANRIIRAKLPSR